MKLQENFEKVSSIWAFEEEKGEGRIYVANITVATCSPQGCVCSHHHQLNHHHHHHCHPKIEKRVIWSKTLKRQRTVCEQRQRKRSKQSWKRGKEGLCRKKNKWKALSFSVFMNWQGTDFDSFYDYLDSWWKIENLPCPVFIGLFMHQVLKCKRLLTYWKNLH